MRIILKDAALVDGVIAKVTEKFPCYQDWFMKYGVADIKERVSEGDPVVIDFSYEWDMEHQAIASVFGYFQMSELPTDEDFINDKEW